MHYVNSCYINTIYVLTAWVQSLKMPLPCTCIIIFLAYGFTWIDTFWILIKQPYQTGFLIGLKTPRATRCNSGLPQSKLHFKKVLFHLCGRWETLGRQTNWAENKNIFFNYLSLSSLLALPPFFQTYSCANSHPTANQQTEKPDRSH